MASFTPSKKTAQDFNNNTQYVNYDPALGINGDIVQADTINNVVEGMLYSQEVAETAQGNAQQAAEAAQTAADTVTDIANNKIDKTEKGAINGVASLDGTGKIPTKQLPDLAVNGEITDGETTLTLTITDEIEGAKGLTLTNPDSASEPTYLNAPRLYENGERVYSPNNPPPFRVIMQGQVEEQNIFINDYVLKLI